MIIVLLHEKSLFDDITKARSSGDLRVKKDDSNAEVIIIFKNY